MQPPKNVIGTIDVNSDYMNFLAQGNDVLAPEKQNKKRGRASNLGAGTTDDSLIKKYKKCESSILREGTVFRDPDVALWGQTLNIFNNGVSKGEKLYVVQEGRSVGLFTDYWNEVKPRVHGYSGAVHSKVKSVEEGWSKLGVRDLKTFQVFIIDVDAKSWVVNLFPLEKWSDIRNRLGLNDQMDVYLECEGVQLYSDGVVGRSAVKKDSNIFLKGRLRGGMEFSE